MKGLLLVIVLLTAATYGLSEDTRTKVWWFHGKYRATREGMTADLEAFREAGLGGVVYYDQLHGEPDDDTPYAMSTQWWADLRYAAEECHRLGLTFEVHVSNGYVAGGPWITSADAMKRIEVLDTIVTIVDDGSCPLPSLGLAPIRTLAIPISTDSALRYISYTTRPRGKATTSATNMPVWNDTILPHFIGTGYRVLPSLGTLQCSNDSITWRDVATLKPLYKAHESYKRKTIAFPATTARYFRLNVGDSSVIQDVVMGGEAKINEVEYKAAFISEYIDSTMATPRYDPSECIPLSAVIDVTDSLASGERLAPGNYHLLHFYATATGAKVKHGRKGLSGLECDKMSTQAAILHFNHYAGAILDSLGTLVHGVAMDSHEAGSQNWTGDFLEAFRGLRGYDLTPYLPIIAGYVIDNVEVSERVLYDYRRTIAQLIADRYYGTLDSLCRSRGVTFTAQATGNAQCIVAVPVEAKGRVSKPQGEVWMMHPDGNYELKETSSAAHLYGKRIASAEAFTDGDLTTTVDSMRRIADIAFAMGINELVICASAHQPDDSLRDGGRCYATYTRNNPKWQSFRPLFDYTARVCSLMRQGSPVADLAIFLGGDAPARILVHRIPIIPAGYDYDVVTNETLCSERRMVVVPPSSFVDSVAQQSLDSMAAAGVVVSYGMFPEPPFEPDVAGPRLLFSHRRADCSDVYFLYNYRDEAITSAFTFRTPFHHASAYDAMADVKTALEVSSTSTITLSLPPHGSTIIIWD